jgi:hypothetical protein
MLNGHRALSKSLNGGVFLLEVHQDHIVQEIKGGGGGEIILSPKFFLLYHVLSKWVSGFLLSCQKLNSFKFSDLDMSNLNFTVFEQTLCDKNTIEGKKK